MSFAPFCGCAPGAAIRTSAEKTFFRTAALSEIADVARFPDQGRRNVAAGRVKQAPAEQSMTMLTVGATTLPNLPNHVRTMLRGDARHFQIAVLAALLAFNIGWIDFGAQPLNSLLAVASALATQLACTRIFRLPALDLRSPLITGLSLSLLLRADAAWVHAVAATIAIGSKFILRIDGKHIWNPAGFAIVVLIFVLPGHVWISPGHWGTNAWFVMLVSCAAFMVLNAARRGDVALFFLACHGALLIARALWLGDPLTIPLHQMQSGSLLIFAFFMITDPRTTPAARSGRFLFALAVAPLAHWLAFAWQMRPALYVALIALSPLTLLLDRIFPAGRFAWRDPAQQGAAR
jgi:Na+-transporting NADH:ubiquinone oxidoreductase subunit NqrB